MKIAFLTLAIASLVSAACKTPLLIDNYTNISTTGTNAVGGYSSDDGTCTSKSGASGVLSLVPGSLKCYFYTTFPNTKPEDAVGGGRGSLALSVAPPTTNWSFLINMKSWNGTNLVDSYTRVAGANTGNQSIAIPLSSFNGPDVPNLRNIRSFVFESFSSTNTDEPYDF